MFQQPKTQGLTLMDMQHSAVGSSPEARGNYPQNLMLTPIFNDSGSANGGRPPLLQQQASQTFPSRPDLTGASQSCMTSYLTHSKAHLLSNATANSLLQLNGPDGGSGGEGVTDQNGNNFLPMNTINGMYASTLAQTQNGTQDNF